jgi:glycine/D-amino acid oxidase-like deaminating enzyme
MDLTSDLPFWTVKNGLLQVYPALSEDVRCDALIVGGGISGALLAHRLARYGIDCVVIDRRDIGHGSTSASTALLQYEIDTPLYKLRSKVGDRAADRAYWLGIDAVHRLQKVAGRKCGFAMRPSLQIASAAGDVPGLRKEFELRRSLLFPVTMLSAKDLRDIGIHGKAAMRSSVAAEVDPYRLTHRLLHLARQRGARIFDRTTALSYRHSAGEVTARTDRNCRIRCRAVFFGSGYETRDILPERIVRFKTTYASVSEPLDSLAWWKDRALIWGTGDPYFYMRTTSDNRVLIGGEDDGVLNAAPRRADPGEDEPVGSAFS